jgi:cytochrome o ubiquinol oxidase subunit IV
MDKNNAKFMQYLIGFILSVVLTFGAYFLVVGQILSGMSLVVVIIFFAVIQLLVQLLFFLHLHQEQKPHWNLILVVNTVGIILIIVVASIWIMDHLNYNMTPGKMDMGEYMMHEEHIQK